MIEPRGSLGRAFRALGWWAAAAALLAGSTGCFAVANLDRFHEGADQADSGGSDAANPEDDSSGSMDDSGTGTEDSGDEAGRSADAAPEAEVVTDYRLFKLELSGFLPHMGQFLEYRIVDGNNFIQSRGFVDPVKDDTFTLIAPRAIPPVNGPYRLDFYVDMNGTRSYDGIGDVTKQDHAWRVDPLADYPDDSQHVDGEVAVHFMHNLLFTDIDQFHGVPNPAADTGVGAFLSFKGMDDHIGELLEVRIAESATGHVVGLYRVTAVPSPEFMLTLPGVIDPGVDYSVDVYDDANVNGVYDNPAVAGGDIGWRLLKQGSDTTGLHIDFDPSTMTNSSVDVGPP